MGDCRLTHRGRRVSEPHNLRELPKSSLGAQEGPARADESIVPRFPLATKATSSFASGSVRVGVSQTAVGPAPWASMTLLQEPGIRLSRGRASTPTASQRAGHGHAARTSYMHTRHTCTHTAPGDARSRVSRKAPAFGLRWLPGEEPKSAWSGSDRAEPDEQAVCIFPLQPMEAHLQWDF